MASLHGARAHGLLDRGAIAPGLRRRPRAARRPRVVRASRWCSRTGASRSYPAATRGRADATRCARCRSPSTSRARRVGAGDRDPAGPADHRRGRGGAAVRDGAVVADPERDLAKIAVIERHHATGRVGLGFVRGFGLHAGAFASTVAHDAHNLVVVGVDDEDMALCAARAQELGGGLVVARDGEVRGELPLPIAGLLSDAPVEEVAEGLERAAGPAARAGRGDRRAVHDAVVPRAVGDPVAEDHRPRAGRRRRVRARAARARRSARRSSPASARCTSTRRGWPSGPGGRGWPTSRSIDAALRAAMYAASEDEQLALIRAHPDLGEKVGAADRALARRAGRARARPALRAPTTSAS